MCVVEVFFNFYARNDAWRSGNVQKVGLHQFGSVRFKNLKIKKKISKLFYQE